MDSLLKDCKDTTKAMNLKLKDNQQESVINKMINHLPEVIAICFGFSFTLMMIIGQIKEN